MIGNCMKMQCRLIVVLEVPRVQSNSGVLQIASSLQESFHSMDSELMGCGTFHRMGSTAVCALYPGW